jgi:uncharacterized membrane protein YkvA (DUF1232 family)/uncharacterized protein YukE
MSRERHLKRLKASLNETQSILGDLIAGTGKDASKRLDKANRRLQSTYDDASTELEALVSESTRDLQKQYASTKKDVQKQYASTAKDFQKQYASTRKDLDKTAAKAKDQFQDRFANASAAVRSALNKGTIGASVAALAAKADLPSKAANAASFLAKTGLAAKAAELATKTDLKARTSNLLENTASGVVSAHNRLSPNDRLVLRHEKDVTRISKAGYFVRFSALAIIIISKRHKLMELGTQLYNRLKDAEGRAQLTQEARDQFDTFRRLIKAYSNGQYRELPYRSLVKIVAAVIYFVSVADLIPDFIPVLGLTDDLAILAWVFASVKDDLQQFVDWEAAEEKRRTRLAGGKSGSNSSTSGTSSDTIANVGGATAADRKASPNVSTTTGSETGSKATVTTGTSNAPSTGTVGGTVGGTTGGGLSGGGSSIAGGTTGSGSAGSSMGGSSSAGNRGGGKTGGAGDRDQS